MRRCLIACASHMRPSAQPPSGADWPGAAGRPPTGSSSSPALRSRMRRPCTACRAAAADQAQNGVRLPVHLQAGNHVWRHQAQQVGVCPAGAAARSDIWGRHHTPTTVACLHVCTPACPLAGSQPACSLARFCGGVCREKMADFKDFVRQRGTDLGVDMSVQVGCVGVWVDVCVGGWGWGRVDGAVNAWAAMPCAAGQQRKGRGVCVC